MGDSLVQLGAAPRPRLPEWARKSRTHFESLNRLKRGLRLLNLHTVCESARCPNIHECFHRGAATFMILGERCTRGCGFCSVPKGNPAKHDMRLDATEPANVARMAAEMKLRYVVITSVNRDDLQDGGSRHFAETVRQVRRALPQARVEVLTPDFCGDLDAVARVLDAGPHVFNHNLETVPRLYRRVRPQADYRQSLEVLAFARRYAESVLTKSGFMVGLGETEEEVRALLRDLRAAGADVATIGQYLQPTRRNLPVAALHRAAPVRGVSRVRPGAGLPNGVQRAAGAQLLHGRRGERGSAAGAVLNWLLALALRGAADSRLSRDSRSGLAGAGGAGAAAGRRGARTAAAGGASCWAGRRAWSTGSASATGSSSCWRSTAAWANLAGWAVFLLFAVAKALHMGVFALAGRNPDAPLVGRARGGGAVGGDGSDARVSGLRVAGAGQCRNRHGAADAPGARHRRVRAFVRLRDDGRGPGAGRCCGGRGWNCCGWLPAALAGFPAAAAARPARAARRRCWRSPTSPKPRSGPRNRIDRMQREQVALTLRGALAETERPPSIVVWPEVPAPLYYDEDPRFRALRGQPGARHRTPTC